MSDSQVRLPIAGGDQEYRGHDEEMGDNGTKNGVGQVDSNEESQTAGSTSCDDDLVVTCLFPSDDDDSDDVRESCNEKRSGDIESGKLDRSLDAKDSADADNKEATMDCDMKKPKQKLVRNSSSGDLPVNPPRRTSFLGRVGGSIRYAWGSFTRSRHRQHGDEVRGDSMTHSLDYLDNSFEDSGEDEKKAEKMRRHSTCVPVSPMNDQPPNSPAGQRSRRQSVPGAFHIQPSISSTNTRSEEHETSASQTSSSQMQGSFEVSETMLRSMLSRGLSVQGNAFGGLDILIPQASVVDDVTVSDAHVTQSSSQLVLVAAPMADNSDRASLPSPDPDESVTVSKHTARFLFISMMILLLGLTTALFFAMRKYPIEVTPFNKDEFVPPMQSYEDTSSPTFAGFESSLAVPALGYDSSVSSKPSVHIILTAEPTSGPATQEPAMPPTHGPSQTPANLPLFLQTTSPTFDPTEIPTLSPTTLSPSQVGPTPEQSSAVPAMTPTPDPTRWSTPLPTSAPTPFPTSPRTRSPTPAPVSVAFDNSGGPVSVALAYVPVTGNNAGGSNGNNNNNNNANANANGNTGGGGNGNNNGGGSQQQTFSVASSGTTQAQQQTFSVVSTGTGGNQSVGTAQSQQQTFSVLSPGNGGGQSGGTGQSQQQTQQQSNNASNGGNGGQQNTNGGGQGGGYSKPQQQSSGSGQGSGNNNNGSGQGKGNNNNGGGDNSGGNTQGQGGGGGNNNGHNNGQGSGGGGSGGGGNGGGNGKGN